MTPLGSPVLPEVYCRKARSWVRTEGLLQPPGGWRNSPTVATCRRSSTWACSSRATSLASGTVISAMVWALPRRRA